jgi:hypothetical protein
MTVLPAGQRPDDLRIALPVLTVGRAGVELWRSPPPSRTKFVAPA